MTAPPPDDAERLRQLAHSLDCLLQEDLCLLCDITPTTAENWRKRGKGPGYIWAGNRPLYPRQQVVDFISEKPVASRRGVPAKDLL